MYNIPFPGILAPMDINAESLDPILSALGEQLHELGGRYELVVVGGSALLALGLVKRSTTDVDILAFVQNITSQVSSGGVPSIGGFNVAACIPAGLPVPTGLPGMGGGFPFGR